MAGLRGALGVTSLVLIAGSIVLLLFVILSGVSHTTPLKKTYFLQADTSSIAGAGRAVSQWTYFYICGEGNQNCGKPVPDLPFGYAWVGGSAGAPEALVGSYGKNTTSKYYYYMWRFGWVFYLISLIFDVFAFFAALVAPCSRLASGISGLILCIATFFMALASALMTTTFVKARKEFTKSGIDAHLGRYGFGFTWGAFAAMLLATIFLFLGCGAGGRSDSTATRSSSKRGRGIFGRKSSRRSVRGSFVDNENESQRRVKDEYA